MIYEGKKLTEISFPIGGIGTGSIGFCGNGEFYDWEIFNRPNKGSINAYTHFAVKAELPSGETIVKILQGDHLRDLSGQYSKLIYVGFGYGPAGGTMCGFPHFKNVTFKGEFPIAEITFSDDDFPAVIKLTAFNPFIPLDADNSSIPAAFFNISVNSLKDDVKYSVLFSVKNPFDASENLDVSDENSTAIMLKCANKSPDEKDYGDMTVSVDSPNGILQQYWYRGAWQDIVSSYWYEINAGDLQNRVYSEPAEGDVATVGTAFKLNSNQEKNIRFVLSWNVPNFYNFWADYEQDVSNILWKNYYATLFKDSLDTNKYCLHNFDELYRKTNEFRNSLHNTTLDPVVVEAVSSTLSVLKSPTVVRLEDGTFYGFEGVHELVGSCEGTCTHVWSYAYALCFLFPELERSLRETEFNYDTEEAGGTHFRTRLPLGTSFSGDRHRPCVDGQMATVFKAYREWKISGDDQWLRNNWEQICKILEFAWSPQNPDEWDRDMDGVLEGRQHHTLDMELFGPSSWLQGMYLAALKAASQMARYLGDTKRCELYDDLFQKGYEFTKDNLFNGKYFTHKVDVTNKSYTEHFDCPQYWNEEKGQLKYQIVEGSIIDQLLGQWHANILGLGDIFDKKQRKIALENMFKNNFKTSMRDFANMWRIFALNDESGSVMCDYPEGAEKPVIPIPYCEECMTGFEYSFAGLLISEGFIDEGLRVIRAVRDRYDGEKRNPFNEIECGSNYARPMASFALLPIFSGFSFDMSNHHIGFSPIVDGDFKCMWSLGSGWGDYIRNNEGEKILIKGGALRLSSISVANPELIKTISADGKVLDFMVDNNTIRFTEIEIKNALTLQY